MVIKNINKMNKSVIILILLFSVINISAYAQCNYADFSESPNELYRKRVKESGMRYGNPYTLFVKGDDFNLNTSITQKTGVYTYCKYQ